MGKAMMTDPIVTAKAMVVVRIAIEMLESVNRSPHVSRVRVRSTLPVKSSRLKSDWKSRASSDPP
jgi:hypothetical protein